MGQKNQFTRMMGLNAPETMPEAAFDEEGVVGVDIAPTDDSLAAGIAAVFDAIRNGDGAPPAESDGADEEGSEDDAGGAADDDNGVTFTLLTELNRLWERAPA